MRGTASCPQAKAVYRPADWDQELRLLEECLKSMNATLETPYDDEFMARKQQALQKQGVSLLTLGVEPEDFVIH